VQAGGRRPPAPLQGAGAVHSIASREVSARLNDWFPSQAPVHAAIMAAAHRLAFLVDWLDPSSGE
jgi:hypothetical protein